MWKHFFNLLKYTEHYPHVCVDSTFIYWVFELCLCIFQNKVLSTPYIREEAFTDFFYTD